MINRQQALEIIEKFDFFQGQRAGRELWADKPKEVQEIDLANFHRDCELLKEFIESQPPADQWIPVTYHETTGEERDMYGLLCPYILDCPLPDEGDEILVCTKRGRVLTDEVCYDEGFYLDCGYDFVEDIAAWMPLPEPYKGGGVDGGV